MKRHLPWLMFLAAAVVYLFTVMQRTTLGVTGVAAAERFEVSAAVLSSLTVVQLVVYASLQVPVGTFIDRLGPRQLLTAGTVLMFVGQLVLAFAPSIEFAVAGRALLGAGDAAIFTSILRLLSSWFPVSRVPVLSQLIGNLGQLGQFLSAVPFAYVLREVGWEPAFVSAAAASVLCTVLVIFIIRDRPSNAMKSPSSTFREVIEQLRFSAKRPSTQMGLWMHFVTQSPATVFTMWWGFPFMVYGLEYTQELASVLLLVMVGSGMACGPFLGVLSARYPARRTELILIVVAAITLAWLPVLLWPGIPPFAVVIVMLVITGIGSPASLIGFDFVRSRNPLASLGSANGIVNIGGFVASFTIVLAVGFVLDALAALGSVVGSQEELYRLDSFRIAFIAQLLIVSFGVSRLLATRRHLLE